MDTIIMFFLRCDCLVLKLVLLAAFAISNQSTAVFGQDCSSKQFERANDYYRVQNYSSAKSILVNLIGCSGTVGNDANNLLEKIQREEACQTIRNSARRAILLRDFETACTFISRMESVCPDFPELGTIKKAAGGCIKLEEKMLSPPPQKPVSVKIILPANPDEITNTLPLQMSEAVPIDHRNGKAPAKPAISTIPEKKKPTKQNIQTETPPTIHVNKTPSLADSEIRPIPERLENIWSAPSKGCSIDDLMIQAQDQNSRNNYYRALDWVRKIFDCDNFNSAAESLKMQIELAIAWEKSILTNALHSFYSGAYDDCYRRLKELIASGKASPQAQKLTEFYLAVSAMNSYLLSGESRPDLKSDGLRHYMNYKSIADGLPIRIESISPRVLQILENNIDGKQP